MVCDCGISWSMIRSGFSYFFKCKVKNSDLLAFYRHDLSIFNHFPKILIDKKKKKKKRQRRKITNYGIMLKKTTFSESR